MSPLEIVTRHALRLGFSMVGVAPAGPLPTWQRFDDWLDEGYAGALDYLARRREERRDVRSVWPGARSVVVLTLDYRAAGVVRPEVLPPNRGIVSSYAWGEDYHRWCSRRLDELLEAVRAELGPEVEGRGYVDTGPILERDLARQAGLGWFGKNTMLIHPQHGSWFFIAELLLSIELPSTPTRVPDRCGRCTRCLVACPTKAFAGPYVLDARRCISYLTVELKGSIPRSLRPLVGGHIFGCDICQEVCPWNRKASETELEAFRPRPDLLAPDLIALVRLMPEEFRARFAGSPILRAKRRGLLRNVAVALGNVGNGEAIPPLLEAISDPEPLVREHAGWALMRRAGKEAVDALAAAIDRESDEHTREDLLLSLEEARRGSHPKTAFPPTSA